MSLDLPVKRTKCATCPFREGSKYEFLANDLRFSALTEGSRICHMTGKENAIHSDTGRPEALCRGARDAQLQAFCALGVIKSPTDEAWNEKRVAIGMKPQPLTE